MVDGSCNCGNNKKSEIGCGHLCRSCIFRNAKVDELTISNFDHLSPNIMGFKLEITCPVCAYKYKLDTHSVETKQLLFENCKRAIIEETNGDKIYVLSKPCCHKNCENKFTCEWAFIFGHCLISY